jgi:Methyltransferase domain
LGMAEAQFQENWYQDSQCRLLESTARRVASLAGDVVEIGSWEGKSTAALANACFPDKVLAVDTWAGSLDESQEHPSVKLARGRDVYGTFLNNMKALTQGNVVPVRMHSSEFLSSHPGRIKFCHIDGSHDYASVKRDIEGSRRLLVDGGILCGDDFLSAHRKRADLNGGVERAVREILPGFRHEGNFWWWINTPPGLWSRFSAHFRR